MLDVENEKREERKKLRTNGQRQLVFVNIFVQVILCSWKGIGVSKYFVTE